MNHKLALVRSKGSLSNKEERLEVVFVLGFESGYMHHCVTRFKEVGGKYHHYGESSTCMADIISITWLQEE